MKRNYVWVAEMVIGNKWEPTVDCDLTIQDAREKLKNRKSGRQISSDPIRIHSAIIIVCDI
jgi:hypothetical protein